MIPAWVRLWGYALLIGVATPALAVAQEVDGKALYDRWCAGCHGLEGRGDGPGAGTMLPRPRDFQKALYKIRTTASGELPTDSDILHVIDVGMPGTTMPGWEDVLEQEERLALVRYVKSLSRYFESLPAPEPIDFGQEPKMSEERIAEGRDVYELLECWKCHGQSGRGDGNSASTAEDDDGLSIAVADLTENWRFSGGGSVEDIYRRVRTGLDGTPMPTFSDLLDAGAITDDQLWSLAHYVRSLAPEEEPEVREVIRASLLEGGALPSTVGDTLWDDAERYYIPLVGQIIVKPRWFNPRVDGIWVQALHDGRDLVLLLSWSDPSRSPDPEWAEYAERVLDVMEPKDEGAAAEPGAGDQVVVQFPVTVPGGLGRPFFLQGDTRRPAYLWMWQSGNGSAVEAIAKGMGTAEPQSAASQVLQSDAEHVDGQWKVLMRRSLSTDDVQGELQFPFGQAVPMAFQAWDGDNGERGNQGAVSTWYFISLREATPVTVLVVPVVAALLTLGLCLVVVSRARQEELEAEESAR